MKYSFSESSEEIILNDKWGFNLFMLKTIMLLNIISSILNIYSYDSTGDPFIYYFWLLIGIVSVLLFFQFLFKISGTKELAISEIKHLKVNSIFGRDRLSLKLKNGKNRHLVTKNDSTEVANFFKEFGIPLK